jgi:hypothetical protein
MPAAAACTGGRLADEPRGCGAAAARLRRGG